MKFLKKRITIRIPVFWTALVLLLVVVIAVCLYLRLPDNLYFMLMEPDWVSSAQIRFTDQWLDLTPEQLTEVVDILNDFRFEKPEKKTIPPPLDSVADIRLKMKTGKTIYIKCAPQTGGGIDYDQYPFSQAMRDLHTLYFEYRQEYLQAGKAGASK